MLYCICRQEKNTMIKRSIEYTDLRRLWKVKTTIQYNNATLTLQNSETSKVIAELLKFARQAVVSIRLSE